MKTLDVLIVSYEPRKLNKPMCNVDRRLEQQIMAMGLNLIGSAIEANLRENNPKTTTDVLGTATQAYTQGKITKNQFMAVINALDEPDWIKNGTKPPTHPMVARLIRDAQLANQ